MTTDFSPFTIRAPASTANFGSAFDAVGMALDLWLEVRVEPAAENAIIMQGEGADQLAGAADQNLIIRAAALGASRLGVELPTLRVTAQNGIPWLAGSAAAPPQSPPACSSQTHWPAPTAKSMICWRTPRSWKGIRTMQRRP